MTPCSSCGESPHASHCAWAPVAPKSTVRAAIDPGSRWIAVVVTRDDGPVSPCNWIDGKCFDVPKVDHVVTYDPPQVRVKARRAIDGVPVEGPLETYEVREERLQSDGDKAATEAARRVLGGEIGAWLTAHGVEACDVETVDHIFGKTPQATSSATKAIRAGEKIVERALTVWDTPRTARGLMSPIVTMLATSWRARVLPLIKDGMRERGEVVAGVMIKGKGTALEPLLVAHVPGWPGGGSFDADHVEHIRDACGLALHGGLPTLPKRASRAGEPRARGARGVRKRGAASSRKRGKMTPERRERVRLAARRQQTQRRAALRPAKVAARAASGCLCATLAPPLRGTHGPACPVAVAMARATVTACTCREDCGRRSGPHRGSCAFAVAKRAARAAPCVCVVEPMRPGRHRAGCPMHRAKAG